MNGYRSPLYQSIKEKNNVDEDSFSDIDDTMERYNKRKGIQSKSKSRDRSVSAKNTDEQPSRNQSFKNQA